MNKLFKFAADVSAMLAALSISACAAEFEKRAHIQTVSLQMFLPPNGMQQK